MNDAQIGLLISAPLLILFALMLYRMGILQRTGTVLAVSSSVLIAASLFLNQ